LNTGFISARKTFGDNNLLFIAPEQYRGAYRPKYQLDTSASPTLYQAGVLVDRVTDTLTQLVPARVWKSQSEGRRTMVSQLISLPFTSTVV